MTVKGWVSVGTAAALLVSGIVMLALEVERDIAIMLVLSALASAGVPAIRDSVRRPPRPPKGPPPAPPGAALLFVGVVVSVLAMGCGGATLAASEVVTVACETTYEQIALEREEGRSELDEARLKLSGAHMVCQAAHTAIEEGAE